MARFSFDFMPNSTGDPSVVTFSTARETAFRKRIYDHALKYLDTGDVNKVVDWIAGLNIKIPSRDGYFWHAVITTKLGRILITVRK